MQKLGEKGGHTLLVRSRTSVLVLERQVLDHRTSFSQANRTTRRRSLVRTKAVSGTGSGNWGMGCLEVAAEQQGVVAARSVGWLGGFVGLPSLRLYGRGRVEFELGGRSWFRNGGGGSNSAAIVTRRE